MLEVIVCFLVIRSDHLVIEKRHTLGNETFFTYHGEANGKLHVRLSGKEWTVLETGSLHIVTYTITQCSRYVTYRTLMSCHVLQHVYARYRLYELCK